MDATDRGLIEFDGVGMPLGSRQGSLQVSCESKQIRLELCELIWGEFIVHGSSPSMSQGVNRWSSVSRRGSQSARNLAFPLFLPES